MAEVTAGDKFWGVLCYLGILVILPLIFKKDNIFVKFHAKQGLVIFILIAILFWIPVANLIFVILAGIASIAGIVYVILGRMQPIPVVRYFAEKMKW